MNNTPSLAVKFARCSCMMSSLRWPLTKSIHGTPWSRAKRRITVLKPSLIGANGAVEAIGNPNCRCTNPTNPAEYRNCGTYTLRYIRSTHSTSNTT
jgi:hypothetical protein